MNPLHLLSYFAGGATLMNAVPHMVSGVLGRKLPSPFAKPPGKGLSSAVVNMLWGFGNLVGAYLLVCQVGRFDPRDAAHIVSFALGMLLLGIGTARHFGGLNGGRGPGEA
jgi:hypothetical protein